VQCCEIDATLKLAAIGMTPADIMHESRSELATMTRSRSFRWLIPYRSSRHTTAPL